MKYIGIVDWADQDKSGNKIAGVIPLYEISDSEWKTADTSEFGIDEKAFWFKATAKAQDLIFFTLKPSYKENGYKFNLDRCEPAKEVLDFRHFGSVDDVRKAFATGLLRYSGHLPEKAYILCKGGAIVGPVNLEVSAADLLKFSSSQIHRIPCYSTDDTNIQTLKSDAITRYVCQDQGPLNIRSYVDWDTNRNVIKRAVEFAVSHSKKNESTATNVRELINDTYQQLKEADNSADLSLELNRLKRSVEIIKQVEIADEWAEELISNLLTLPAIQDELEITRTKVEDETRDEIIKELESEIAEIEKIREEKDKLEEEILDYQEKLKQIKENIDLQTGEIEEEIRKRVKTAVEKPAEIIAESAFLKAILPYLSSEKDSKPINTAPPYTTHRWEKSNTIISTADDLRKRLSKACREIGIKSEVGLYIHAALSARIMPILTGFSASAAIEAYAQIACAGRIFHAQISPTTIDTINLFGGSNNFFAHENNLLQFIETANQNSEPAIVVFEGINRAPTESYLIPLLKSIFFKKSFPLTSSGNGTQNFDWSENLFLVATLVDGPTTLPLSFDIWSRSVLIEAQGQYKRGEYKDYSEIDINSDLLDSFEDPFEIDHIFEEFPEFENYRMLAERFLNGLQHFYNLTSEINQAQLEKILIETIISPLIASINSDEERNAAIKKLANLKIDEFKDQQTINAYIKNVMRKIA
jgi:hypothetical protein